MLIYVIRHGETEYNRDGRLQGQVDIPLDENGIMLGRITGEGLKDVRFDLIMTSPLKRAVQTAELVTEASRRELGYSCPVIKDDRLMEIDVGIWDGKYILPDRMEIEDDNFLLFLRDPEHFQGFPEGETLQDVMERTGEVLEELIRRKDLEDKTILISTHGCAMRSMLQKVYHDDKGFWHGHSPHNYAVNIIRVENNAMELIADDLLFYDQTLAVNPYK